MCYIIMTFANPFETTMKRLLTIQDISCVGQCSLTVALPVISACGVETAILPSAVLSTHTGFPHFRIHDLTDDMPLIEEKWLANGLKFDAFYTGYVRENQIQPILDIMERCAAPGAVRIVDPVMADYGKLYAGFDDDFAWGFVNMADFRWDDGICPAPEFSLESGNFGKPVEVSLSVALEDAGIYFTTDGSAPSPENGIRLTVIRVPI